MKVCIYIYIYIYVGVSYLYELCNRIYRIMYIMLYYVNAFDWFWNEYIIKVKCTALIQYKTRCKDPYFQPEECKGKNKKQINKLFNDLFSPIY